MRYRYWTSDGRLGPKSYKYYIIGIITITVQAYKKLAMQWHPDKFQDEEDKKTAEKKFMDIAAAKEVLLDEGTYTYVPSVKHCIILWASVLTWKSGTLLLAVKYVGCPCNCMYTFWKK